MSGGRGVGGGRPVPPQTGEAGEPNSPLDLGPLDLGPRGWKHSVRRAVAEFKADRGGMAAAGLAFYWFLAVFPALLASVGVLGLVNAGSELAESIAKGIRTAMPGDAADVLTRAVERAQGQSEGASLTTALVGVVLALWGASAGFVALQAGLDVAYDVPAERKFVGKRVVALVLTVATGVLGGLASVLVVFGQPLGETLRDNLPLGAAFVAAWTSLRWLLALGAILVLFAVFYYLAPNRRSPRWAWVSPGSLVALVGWVLASLAFSVYVGEFGRTSYGRTYGSLAGVVVLLVWLYVTALAILFGGELNAELEREAAAAERRRPQGRAGDSQQGREAWRERMRELRERAQR